MPSPIKADDLWTAWSRSQWKTVYLFAGQEDFLIDQAIQRATTHWLGNTPDPLSIDKLDAEEKTADDVLQAAQTVPFFGGKRLLILKNTSQLSPTDQKSLSAALPSFSQDTLCLFVWGREWRREDSQKALIESISERGQVVIFWPLFPEQAQRWLIQRAKHYQKTLSPQGAAWLVQQAGEGLRFLDQELAKCSQFVAGRPDIDIEDIQNSFGYGKVSSPFDWVATIRQSRTAQAMAVLDRLLKDGEEPVRLLALISKSLRDWLAVKGTGENPAMLALRFHVKRGEEHRFAQELNVWSEERLAEGINLCVQAEQQIKTGKETPEMALTLLTLSLSSRQMAHALS